MAMRWLNNAANGSVAFQRYVEAGNPRLPGKGVRNETYGAVEAALFRSKGRATSVIQNVSDEARVWRIKPDLKLGAPSLVERLELPDLTDSTPCAARLQAVSVSPTLAVRIPPYSLTRLINFFAADTSAFRRGEERRPPNVETSKHTRLNRRWLVQSDHRLKTPPRGQRFQNSLSNTRSSKGWLETKTGARIRPVARSALGGK